MTKVISFYDFCHIFLKDLFVHLNIEKKLIFQIKNSKIMIYQVIKPTVDSNSQIKELNAKVLSSTFKDKIGVQKGDLYSTIGSSNEIVAHKTCAPAVSKFIKTIELQF